MELPDADPIQTFLVERYWPDVDLAELRDAEPRLDAAVHALAGEGHRIAYLGSILMPADQVVFSLVAAEDEAVVHLLNDRAGLPADRIAVAITLLGAALAAPSFAAGGGSRPSPTADHERDRTP